MAFVKINKHRIFGGKRYTLEKAFLTKVEAGRLAVRLRKEGKSARVVEKAGEVNFFTRFHVYVRG